jgi:hypothetical protein
MIRPLASALLAAAVATAAAAQEAPDHTVYFDFDSAALDAEARETVARAAEDYRATGSADLFVEGHTDTVGTQSYNLDLSRRRAETVRDALMAQGVPPDAIETAAVGQNDLAVPTADGVRLRENRRVTINFERPRPAAAPAPSPQPAEPLGINYAVGAFFGYGLSTSETRDGDAFMPGLNVAIGYELGDFVELEAEQAVFYTFADGDDGFGARTVGGANLLFRRGAAIYHVGANIGGIYTADSDYDDVWVAGPEIGARWGNLHAKLAYDIPLDRDWDDGVVAATLGLAFRF